jgi:hypothetical protein
MRWVKHVACMAEKKETCQLLAIEPKPERLIRNANQCGDKIKKKSGFGLDRTELIRLPMRKRGGLFFLFFSICKRGNCLHI